MSTSTIKKVASIKASLSKKVSSVDSLEESDVESCKDMFQQLSTMDITLDVLSKTLIGTIVSKFKNHNDLGPTAKLLVKKWKKIAKGEGVGSGSNDSAAVAKAPPAADAAAAASSSSDSKTKRRDSTMSTNSESASDLKEEWLSLQPYQRTTCEKLCDFLKQHKPALVKQGINGNAVDALVIERATEIEHAMSDKFKNKKTDYLSKARSLCFNIKKNVGLSTNIILGQTSASELVEMSSEDMATEEQKKEMHERNKKVMDSKQLDWAAQNEDKINEMCGIKGELLQASLFTWYVLLWMIGWEC
jgi:transcription elongation factor S-II